MVNWLIIGVVILAIFVVAKLIHFRHIKHKIFAIGLILLLFFAYTTFSSVIRGHELDVKTATGVYQAVRAYGSWLGLAFSNVRVVTGNVINLDWAPSLSGSAVEDSDVNSKSSKTADIEYV